MRKFPLKSFAFVILLLSQGAAGSASGQWRIVAHELTTTDIASGSSEGAICWSSGILWIANHDTLYRSSDTGRTWSKVMLPAPYEEEIQFWDSSTGVLASTSGTWLTTNGGSTWRSLGPAVTSAVFLNDSKSVLIAPRSDGLSLTTDGGKTWTSSTISDFPFCVRYKAGVAYGFTGSGPYGHLYTSTNFGQSWNPGAQGIDWDSFSFGVDSCDPNRIYMSHEDVVAPTDQYSKIFVSTDRGNSWQTVVSQPLPYFCGSVAEGYVSVYCQTFSNGIFRSTDQGATWVSIGGPSMQIDTRLVAAVSDNIVVALDNEGNVWRTDNSGGDSIIAPSSSVAALIVPRTTVVNPEQVCGTIDTSISLLLAGCGVTSGMLDSLWLTGSSAFSISDTRGIPHTIQEQDSISIAYAPSQGRDTTELHLRYDLGSGVRDTSIELIGTPSLAASSLEHRGSAAAYRGQEDSLPMLVDVSSSLNLDSLWPSVTGIEATYSWDSSVVHSIAYVPPTGWGINSLAARGNSEDISIAKISALASNPLELGMALFEPTESKLATTWVNLPRLILDVGNSSVSLCVTQNEDSHWSVKDLGASDVQPIPTSNEDISIYPNPASGNVWIASTADLGTVTIQVYDMLGTEHTAVQMNMMKATPMELALPPTDGMYTVVVRSALRTFDLRVLRGH